MTENLRKVMALLGVTILATAGLTLSGVGPAAAIDPCETPGPGFVIEGTPGDDVLNGTPRDDLIRGHGGDDVIHGLGGNDVIHGDPGADSLYGDDGCDEIYGDKGADVLDGGAGNDLLFGEEGYDTGFGGTGVNICDVESAQVYAYFDIVQYFVRCASEPILN
ncbi:calcium-binding protein [Actinoplanes sp. NPDC026670]|uniref:calcium-binding protein n=1 Tax=Actinoplanes sp. NPDC026670 TaxID=3154700 RepID=UPI0033D076CC